MNSPSEVAVKNRRKRVAAGAVISFCLAVLAVGCGSQTAAQHDGTSRSGASQSPAPSSDSSTGLPLVSRVRTYDNVSELVMDSALVVIAHSEGGLEFNSAYGDAQAPFGLMKMSVDKVLVGGVPVKGSVTVSVEAGYRDNGDLYTTKLTHDDTYLLFLTPLGDKAPGVFAVTGYMAGIYRQTGPDTFEKVDTENPGLPDTLSASDVQAP